MRHITSSLEGLITDTEPDRWQWMQLAELKAELEGLHTASFGWALACCRGDRSEAEEVLQMVYVKILEGKARFGGESSLKTWLFAVIRKTASTQHRRRLGQKLVSLTGFGKLHESASSTEAPAAALERSDTRERFRIALSKLPPRQREALHLVFYEDLSLREAAAVMGVSIGTARQHYERGKKHLRESLIDKEIGYETSWRNRTPGAVL